MEKRELLEAAARAGAPEAPRHTQGWRYSKAGPFGEGMYAAADRTRHWFWNPLTKDGDALRLAVKLGITIDLVDKSAYRRDSLGHLVQEYWGGDYPDCYRRAITRAAAAISSQNRGVE